MVYQPRLDADNADVEILIELMMVWADDLYKWVKSLEQEVIGMYQHPDWRELHELGAPF